MNHIVNLLKASSKRIINKTWRENWKVKTSSTDWLLIDLIRTRNVSLLFSLEYLVYFVKYHHQRRLLLTSSDLWSKESYHFGSIHHVEILSLSRFLAKSKTDVIGAFSLLSCLLSSRKRWQKTCRCLIVFHMHTHSNCVYIDKNLWLMMSVSFKHKKNLDMLNWKQNQTNVNAMLMSMWCEIEYKNTFVIANGLEKTIPCANLIVINQKISSSHRRRPVCVCVCVPTLLSWDVILVTTIALCHSINAFIALHVEQRVLYMYIDFKENMCAHKQQNRTE